MLKVTEHENIAERQFWIVALLVSFLIIIVSLYFRPILPLDETRYTSVAWEMWQSNNWLVPHINGDTYAHKPPMMFWLMNIMWAVFGVSEWAARIVVPLIACVNYYLIKRLAQLVYPGKPQVSSYSPLILLSFAAWLLYVPTSMFDLLLTVFVLGNIISSWRFAETGQRSFAVWAGLSLGIGMLVKGPAMFVYTLPVILAYGFWRREGMISGRSWAKGCAISIAIAVAIILSWALPAAIAGGQEYAQAIFWKQSAGRMQDSFSHARPFYWYAMLLPVLLAPWILLRGAWRSQSWFKVSDSDKFCLAWFLFVGLVFSLISGKQIHYLFPVMPALAMFIAAKIEIKKFQREPFFAAFLALLAIAIFAGNFWAAKAFPASINPKIDVIWGLIPLFFAILIMLPQRSGKNHLLVVLVALPLSINALLPALSSILNQNYNVTETAQFIRQKQDQGVVVAHMGKYHNQFQFLGRLSEPLVVLDNGDADRDAWLVQNPDALVVLALKHADPFLLDNSEYSHPFRGRQHVLIRAALLTRWYEKIQEEQSNSQQVR